MSDQPLVVDLDWGIQRAAAGVRKDSVRITAWSEAAAMTADDLAPYKTIVIDTAGRALDFLSADIIVGNPKMGRGDGSLTLQGFGALKSRFSAWLKQLNTYGKDIILLCHMDEVKSGDEMVERLDVVGGSKGEIYKSVDCMGRIFIRNKQRVIDFSPRENAFGKNPANLDVLVVPDVTQNDHFLADVIASIKKKLNALSESQLREQQAVEEWCSAINQYDSVDDFNRNLKEIKKAPKAAELYFHQQARKQGLVANRKTKLYEEPPQVKPEQTTTDATVPF